MKASDSSRQGARDLAGILPFVVAILLVPPMILIFAKPIMVAGVPLIFVYLFGVWAAAILCAMLVSRRLAEADAAAIAEAPDENGRR
jgi:hypothetical protein